MSVQDAVIQLLAIRGFGKKSAIETRKAQIAFLHRFTPDQQAEIILGVCMADRDHAMSIVQGMRDEVAAGKGKTALDVLSGR